LSDYSPEDYATVCQVILGVSLGPPERSTQIAYRSLKSFSQATLSDRSTDGPHYSGTLQAAIISRTRRSMLHSMPEIFALKLCHTITMAMRPL